MYCKTCGKPIEEESRFCSFCGSMVRTVEIKKDDENIPTFDIPSDDMSLSEDLSDDIPIFETPESLQLKGKFCYYHKAAPAEGQCARCGKFLCQNCCDSYGVVLGEYAGKNICYDCTQELVEDNITQLNNNRKVIKKEFKIHIIGFIIGILIAGPIGGVIGWVGLSAIKVLITGVVQIFGGILSFSVSGNSSSGLTSIGSGIGDILGLTIKCGWISITQSIKYISYMKKTAGFVEQDTEFLKKIKEQMEYTLIRQQYQDMELEVLMQEGGVLYNNSYAQMVFEQGEVKAEAYVNQCVTRIAENGEIIRDFPNAV